MKRVESICRNPVTVEAFLGWSSSYWEAKASPKTDLPAVRYPYIACVRSYSGSSVST
jgi:hypothetical protein